MVLGPCLFCLYRNHILNKLVFDVQMKTQFVFAGNLLLLCLIIVVIIEKVYSHRFSPEKQVIIAYAEIGLVFVLVIFYGCTIFYKYLRKR
jgi:hypothetical protein